MGKKYVSALSVLIGILILLIFRAYNVRTDNLILKTYEAAFSEGPAKSYYSSIEDFINDSAVVISVGGMLDPESRPLGSFEVAILYPTPMEDNADLIMLSSYGFSWMGQKKYFEGGQIDLNNPETDYVRDYYRALYHRRKFAELDESRLWQTSFDKGDIVAGDKHWRIPEEYNGTDDRNIGSLSVSTGYISIKAKAPNFIPVSLEEWQLHSSIQLRSRDWINGLGEGVIDVPSTSKLGDLTFIKNGKSGADWYFKLDDNGNIATIIACYSSREVETACQHRFYREDMMFTFDHSRDFLQNSNEMENALFDLLKSFEVKH